MQFDELSCDGKSDTETFFDRIVTSYEWFKDTEQHVGTYALPVSLTINTVL